MVLMGRRLLAEAKRDIYLQGAVSFHLPKQHRPIKLYCSSHNLGAAELAMELNSTFAATKSSVRRQTSSRRGILQGCPDDSGLLQILDDPSSSCDHMLLYLNTNTWTHDPEALAADIREVQRLGVHLQASHEFPSVLDMGSARGALDFDAVMLRATPEEMKSGETSIYTEIAIGLKGGEQREVGLALLAEKLVEKIDRRPIVDGDAAASSQRGESVSALARAGGVKALFRKLKGQVMSRSRPGPFVDSSLQNAGEVSSC
eukprot:7162496-Prymnesium_polylepis.1